MSRRACLLAGAAMFAALVKAEPASQPAALTIQPIAYFEQSCARCHGDYGSNYGNQFAANLDDAKLSKVVDDMCSGPGNAPLAGADLQAEIAFHRALADHKPFICVTKREGQIVSGEVSPGATLVALDGSARTEIKVDEAGAWSATVSPTAGLVATLKDQTTTLSADALFSHGSPKQQ